MKSKIGISEIHSDIYAIYLKILKYKMLPLVLNLCTYLQGYTIRTNFARLYVDYVINTLLVIEI